MSLLRGLELAYTPIVDFFRNLMSDIQGVISTSLPTVPQITIPQLPRAGFLDNATISSIAARGNQQGAGFGNNTGWIDELANKIAEKIYSPIYNANLDVLDASGRMDDIYNAIRAGKEIIVDGQRLGRISQNVNNGRSAMLGGAV